jgi:hypothetical protein
VPVHEHGWPVDLKTALRRQLFPQYSAIPMD